MDQVLSSGKTQNRASRELDKTSKVNDDNLADLMQYYELVQEIRKANGVQI